MDFANTGWIFAGSAAAITLVASCWSYIRNICSQISSRVVVHVTVNGEQYDAMLLYLRRHFKASKWGGRTFSGSMMYVRKISRVQLIPMETVADGGKIFWLGFRPIWVNKISSGDDKNSYVPKEEILSLTFIRGTFDIEDLMVRAATYYNEQVVSHSEHERRYGVYHVLGTAGRRDMIIPSTPIRRRRNSGACDATTSLLTCRPLGISFSELGQGKTTSAPALEKLALTEEIIREIDNIRWWKDNENWFKTRGIPWKRGWLLYGEPGTGKTVLTRAIAEDLDLPIFVFHLSTFHNEELIREWSRTISEVPCIILIEDIDAVFDGRENVSAGDGSKSLTFDCLLNCLDGVESASGVFVIITTNKPEKLDPAIAQVGQNGQVTRPGRVDVILKLNGLNDNGRHKIVSRILPDYSHLWEEIVKEGENDTGAQFQERCARRAMQLAIK